MNSFSIADELDQAVCNVLAGVETAGVNADLEMDELANIAAELQHLPQPQFKAQLKAQLTGRTVFDSAIVEPRVASQIQIARIRRETEIAVLPSLFGNSSDGYPLHQRSMAASFFASRLSGLVRSLPVSKLRKVSGWSAGVVGLPFTSFPRPWSVSSMAGS